MSFKDQLAGDAVNAILNEDELAEEITYIPKAGSSLTISAIVIRGRITPDGETDRILQNRCEIYIANHATFGVTSVNKGSDKVIFPARVGESAVQWSVVDIFDNDEGMWHLLAQR